MTLVVLRLYLILKNICAGSYAGIRLVEIGAKYSPRVGSLPI